MGGFTLTGPTKIIKSVNKDNIYCKCKGLIINISQEIQDIFEKNNNCFLSYKQFHEIFNNEYTSYHILDKIPEKTDGTFVYFVIS